MLAPVGLVSLRSDVGESQDVLDQRGPNVVQNPTLRAHPEVVGGYSRLDGHTCPRFRRDALNGELNVCVGRASLSQLIVVRVHEGASPLEGSIVLPVEPEQFSIGALIGQSGKAGHRGIVCHDAVLRGLS